MIRYAHTRAALVAAAFALLPAAAMAQAPAMSPAAPPGAPTAAGNAALPKDAGTRLDQHNKQLHDQLGITPAQQPQWDQFIAVTRSNAFAMHQAFTDRGAKLGTMSAVDNMQSYADLAKVHSDNMAKAATAFQTLYASLSPEQKLSADAIFRNRAEKQAAAKPGAKKK
jgi:protein CpxP